jgi:hypothetical protein
MSPGLPTRTATFVFVGVSCADVAEAWPFAFPFPLPFAFPFSLPFVLPLPFAFPFPLPFALLFDVADAEALFPWPTGPFWPFWPSRRAELSFFAPVWPACAFASALWPVIAGADGSSAAVESGVSAGSLVPAWLGDELEAELAAPLPFDAPGSPRATGAAPTTSATQTTSPAARRTAQCGVTLSLGFEPRMSTLA